MADRPSGPPAPAELPRIGAPLPPEARPVNAAGIRGAERFLSTFSIGADGVPFLVGVRDGYVRAIQTLSPAFSTPEGVRVGDPLASGGRETQDDGGRSALDSGWDALDLDGDGTVDRLSWTRPPAPDASTSLPHVGEAVPAGAWRLTGPLLPYELVPFQGPVEHAYRARIGGIDVVVGTTAQGAREVLTTNGSARTPEAVHVGMPYAEAAARASGDAEPVGPDGLALPLPSGWSVLFRSEPSLARWLAWRDEGSPPGLDGEVPSSGTPLPLPLLQTACAWPDAVYGGASGDAGYLVGVRDGTIVVVETQSEAFATPEGVRRGMPWADALRRAEASDVAAADEGRRVVLPSGWTASTRPGGTSVARLTRGCTR